MVRVSLVWFCFITPNKICYYDPGLFLQIHIFYMYSCKSYLRSCFCHIPYLQKQALHYLAYALKNNLVNTDRSKMISFGDTYCLFYPFLLNCHVMGKACRCCWSNRLSSNLVTVLHELMCRVNRGQVVYVAVLDFSKVTIEVCPCQIRWTPDFLGNRLCMWC